MPRLKVAQDPVFDFNNKNTLLLVALMLQPTMDYYDIKIRGFHLLVIIICLEDALSDKYRRLHKVKDILNHAKVMMLMSTIDAKKSDIKWLIENGYLTERMLNKQQYVTTTLKTRNIVAQFMYKVKFIIETMVMLERPENKRVYRSLMYPSKYSKGHIKDRRHEIQPFEMPPIYFEIEKPASKD